MAKSTDTVLNDYRFKAVNSKQSTWAHVYHFADRNPRRTSHGTAAELLKDIINPFIEFGGWRSDENMIVQRMTKEDADQATENLKADWEQYKAAPHELDGDAMKMALARLKVFERDYTVKGKIIRPTFEGITANRRAGQIINIKAECLLKDLPFSDYVNMQLPTTEDGRFRDTDDRIAFAVLENRKTEGFRPMQPYDEINTIMETVIRHNKSTGWMEKNLHITGTKRVVQYGLARFCQYTQDELHLDWNVLGRLNPDEQFKGVDDKGKPIFNPEYIDYALFNTQQLWQGRTEDPYKDVPLGAITDISKDLEVFNRQRIKDNKPTVQLATKEFLEEMFPVILSGDLKKGTKKIMARKRIDNLKGHSCKPVRLVRDAIMADEPSKMNPLIERAELYNLIHDLHEPVAEAMKPIAQILTGYIHEPDVQLQAIESMLTALKETIEGTKV